VSTVSEPMIYLVDDDAPIRDAMIIFFEVCGYSVEVYDSSEAVLQHADDIDQGVLVLDIRLPGISGIELQTELQKRGINIPVIFVTGHGDEEIKRAVKQAGAIGFFEKPIDHSALLNLIDSALTKMGN
jgi:two-component system response regulator FixJ